MNVSKREMILKIARARALADYCHKKYGGSIYPFLTGAYEAVFCDLLGFDSFEEMLQKVGEVK